MRAVEVGDVRADVASVTPDGDDNSGEVLYLLTRKASKRRMALLDLMLTIAKSDPTFSHSDIQEEVDTFMFAVSIE